MNNGHLSFAFTMLTAGSVNDELRVCVISMCGGDLPESLLLCLTFFICEATVTLTLHTVAFYVN
jgi:hypothetical protein